MKNFINTEKLEGNLVTLSKMEKSHVTPLLKVIKQCNFPLTTTPRSEEIVGSTRLANFEYWEWSREDALRFQGYPDAVEIGWTWLSPETHGTGINAEAKLLQLTFAFETLKVKRVTLKTDERNVVSRNAMLKLGATFEGILRLHSPAADTGIRNTAMFSILYSEWPLVKEQLVSRVERFITST